MIHVLTLNWNGADKLLALESGLLANLSKTEEKYHWHIKDNGSKDGSKGLFSDNKNITIYDYGHNRDNFSKGMNWLFEKAGPKDDDYILLLNNDVQFNDDLSLKTMIDLQKQSSAEVVGARLLYPNASILQHAGVIFSTKYNMMPYHYRHKVESDLDATKNRHFQAVTAAVCLVRAKAFREVGGFNEGFNWSFEDIDLCLRIGKRNGNNIIYCGGTDISHEESASLAKNPVNKMFVGPNVALFKKLWGQDVVEDLGNYSKDPRYRVHER